jgi:hypothetical protein
MFVESRGSSKSASTQRFVSLVDNRDGVTGMEAGKYGERSVARVGLVCLCECSAAWLPISS